MYKATAANEENNNNGRIYIYIYIYMYIYIYIYKVKLATVVEGDQKVPFSRVATPRCRVGPNSFP